MSDFMRKIVFILIMLSFAVVLSAKGNTEGTGKKGNDKTKTGKTEKTIPNKDKSLPPQFSVEHGFFNEPFELFVTVDPEAPPESVIRYTLDGSDPRTSPSTVEANSSVTVRVDPDSKQMGRAVSAGFIVRACTKTPGLDAGKIITHSYFFPDRVADLSARQEAPGPGWRNPASDNINQWIDYQMDPDITGNPEYADLIDDALLSLPTLSLVTDVDNLFDRSKGIYVNANQHGREWERPASVELIFPDGDNGFQVNTGVRIRGGWSRHPDNPKHAFRFFFRKEYGDAKLKYPLFGEDGADNFDKLDLRTSQNYSWSYKDESGEYNTMNKDVFSHDLQGLTGNLYTRSRYCHLYINGIYWGLYQLQERPEADFAASYQGGSSKDYDVIKPEIKEDYQYDAMEATDGTLDTWKDVWDLTRKGFISNKKYFRLLGCNSDGSRNKKLPVLVDIKNLVDFMHIIFFTANADSPTSNFLHNKLPRNFFGIYKRGADKGFQFVIHDAEHSLNTMTGIIPGANGVYENRVNLAERDDDTKMKVYKFLDFHPQWLFHKLCENEEFRMLVADRAYEFFFNDGIMTPQRAAALFTKRSNEISTAIITESARWGDSYHTPARTREDWENASADIVNNFFPVRTEIVINQLKDAGLYPKLDPPVYSCGGKILTADSFNHNGRPVITVSNPNKSGSVLYTLDGSDPRSIGGSVSPNAIKKNPVFSIRCKQETRIKARTYDGKEWSAIHEILVIPSSIPLESSNLIVSEIHYHPLDGDNTDDGEYEFIELYNSGSDTIDISGWSFADNSIKYTFPAGTTLEPGKYLVLASCAPAFFSRYDFMPGGEYKGRLSNSGEKIVMLGADNDEVFSFIYDDKAPWPVEADGSGYSLERIPGSADPANPDSWRLSDEIGGSPGR